MEETRHRIRLLGRYFRSSLVTTLLSLIEEKQSRNSPLHSSLVYTSFLIPSIRMSSAQLKKFDLHLCIFKPIYIVVRHGLRKNNVEKEPFSYVKCKSIKLQSFLLPIFAF